MSRVSVQDQPSQKRLRITQRDIEAMQTLARYHVLRESALHALLFSTIKEQRNVQFKLKRLVDQEYIGRRFPPLVHRSREFINFSHQDRRDAVYFLGPGGAELIGCEYNSNIKGIKHYGLNHRLDIADIRACLELAIQAIPHIELAQWINEYDKDEEGIFLLHDEVVIEYLGGKKKRLPIRPDACFILEEKKTNKQALFFLEVDEGTESAQKRFRDKVVGYRAYQQQGFREAFEFEGKGFRVLTITRSESGKEPERRKTSLVEVTHEAGGRRQFWFATFDQVMPGGKVTGDHLLQSPIWKRVDEELEEPEVVLAEHLFV